MSWINVDQERDQRRVMPAPHFAIDNSGCVGFLAFYVCMSATRVSVRPGEPQREDSVPVLGQARSVVTIMYLYKCGRVP
jgi:hypothetical protein